MADRLQTLNSAIDELTKLRQKEARDHSDEVVELMREKAELDMRLFESMELLTEAHFQMAGFKMQLTELRNEFESREGELNSMVEEKERWRQETLSLREEKAATDNRWKAAPQKMLDKWHSENEKVAQLFRDHLDDSANDMENDNEWEREARKITWNEEDVKASRNIHVAGM